MEPNENNQNEKYKNENASRSLIYGLIAILVIGGIVYVVSQMNNAKEVAVVAPSGEEIKKREVSLSGEERQQLEARVSELEQEIQALPADATAEARFQPHLRLASSHYGLGNYEQAIATLDKIANENQDKGRVFALYSNIYRDMGNIEKARENARKALDLEKDNPAYWLAYINLSADQKTDDVKAWYEEAVQSTETNLDVVTSYAKFLEAIGDKQGAIAQWQKAGEINPEKKAEYDAEIQRLQNS